MDQPRQLTLDDARIHAPGPWACLVCGEGYQRPTQHALAAHYSDHEDHA